jgi:hypothetical protein
MDALGEIIGFDHTETEQGVTNSPYLFDTIMLYAEQTNAFLIDLRGEVEIVGTEDSTVLPRGNAEDTSDYESPLPQDVIVATDQAKFASAWCRFRAGAGGSIRSSCPAV